MALFFDRLWFEACLKEAGLTRDAFAAQSGLSWQDLDLMIKDQMEISADLIKLWSAILKQPAHDVANKCGVLSPIAQEPTIDERVVALEARVRVLEAQMLALIKPTSGLSD
jgi:hypothetical protein